MGFGPTVSEQLRIFIKHPAFGVADLVNRGHVSWTMLFGKVDVAFEAVEHVLSFAQPNPLRLFLAHVVGQVVHVLVVLDTFFHFPILHICGCWMLRLEMLYQTPITRASDAAHGAEHGRIADSASDNER